MHVMYHLLQWLMAEPAIKGDYRKFNSNGGFVDDSDDAAAIQVTKIKEEQHKDDI